VPSRARRSALAWDAFVICSVIALGAYVSIRAATLSFTHDESFSYTRFVHDPFTSVVFYDELSANNHLLNTLAMKVADSTFGASELALRAPTVAAFAVYVVALWLLLRRVSRWPARLLGFSLAIANPYLLDFFSLARGYGLALALVAASAALTVGYVERPTLPTALGSAAFAALAVFASFVTIGYFVGVLLVTVLRIVVPKDGRSDGPPLGRLAAALSLPAVVVLVFTLPPQIRLRRAGELYFGGEDGFWRDTVRSLVSSTLERRDWDVLEVVLVVVVAVAVVGGFVAAAVSIRRRTLPLHTAAFILLATPAVVSVTQHFVLGSHFLVERTALFLVPLFAIWLAFASDALARLQAIATAVSVCAVAIASAAWVNLAAAANLSYSLDWRYDASTERMLGDVDRLRDGRRIELGATWLFEPTINFYRGTKELSWLPPLPMDCRHECVADRADYYFVTGTDVEVVRNRGACIVREYPLSGSILLGDRALACP
jgi:hypothetical protein